MSHGARASIQAETSKPTAKRRETERPTEAEKSYSELALEERGEERQRGRSGGGADDVEGRVEEVFGVVDQGELADLAAAKRLKKMPSNMISETPIISGAAARSHSMKAGSRKVDAWAEVQAGAQRAKGVEQSGAEDDAGEHANHQRVDVELLMKEAARRGRCRRCR